MAAAVLPVQAKDNRFSELIQHQVASHLLERIVNRVSDERFLVYYTTYFRGHLAELCEKPSPSFVVQQVVANARDSPQLEMMFTELQDSWPTLLRHNRAGVVLRLLEACNKRSILQKRAAKSAVNEISPVDKPFIQKLLETKDPVSAIGSMIAIEVLRATAPDNRALLESFLSLSPEYIIAVSKSPVGSQVLEAFLGIVQPPKLKKKFIKRLYTHFIELARDKYGSHCLDKIYRQSEVSQKIAEELAPEFESLSKDFYGRFAVRNCRVEAFVRAKEGWKGAETQSDKKRKAFLEIFENDAPPMPLPVHEASKERKEKREKKNKAAPAAVAEDVKMSEKTKKIYDALLPATAEEEGEVVERTEEKGDAEAKDESFMKSIRSALRGGGDEQKEKKRKKKSKKEKKDDITATGADEAV